MRLRNVQAGRRLSVDLLPDIHPSKCVGAPYFGTKIMVIDFKLTYPNGTANAHLIYSFHTPQGAKLANY
ncbi:hypothetical protein RIF29_24688 [Crotalaria pallida]|uniref:Uncharacterized protein n=1 Tax=Crotalaria pallida TaxID=3830 RepID=A0AAN9EKT7_CROPI